MTLSKSRLAFALTASLALAAPWDTPRAQQAPRFTSGVEIIAVDATVLDREGSPVTSLGPDDFAVTVGGKPRRVVSLQLITTAGNVSAAASPGAPAPLPTASTAAAARGGRLFIIAIDRHHIRSGEGLAMLDAAARFIDTLPPEDRVAVYPIPPSSPRLQLSTDRGAAKKAVRNASGIYRPPSGLYVIGADESFAVVDKGDQKVFWEIVARECDATGEVKNGAATPECIAKLRADVPMTAMDWHNRAQVTLTCLEDLLKALAPLDGPKHVVLVTGGPAFSPTELSYISSTSASASSSRVTIHAIQVHENARAGVDRLRSTPFESDQLNTSAVQLAIATGGLWVTPASPAGGFMRLSKELSASYLLGIEAEAGDRDGKVHQIDVAVKAVGWRGTVRARRSFRIDPSAPRLTTPSAPAPPAAAVGEPPEEPVAADLDAMVDRLGGYVERFDRQFAGFVAEERYVQVIHPWRGNPQSPEKEPSLAWKEGEPWQTGQGVLSRRQLVSDLLLVPVNGQPMAFRDVALVDGRPVRDRTDRVRSLFLSNAPDRVGRLRTLTEESSRYNLGTLKRTLNVPTVALSFLRRVEHHRFKFRRLKDETVYDRLCRVLGYVEKERPTLVGTSRGGDMPIEGRVWIDAATGDVLRTELRWEMRSGGRRSCIQVDFVREPRVSVLVPWRMWEWHEGATVLGSLNDDTMALEGLATYSNYRHFEVNTSEQVK